MENLKFVQENFDIKNDFVYIKEEEIKDNEDLDNEGKMYFKMS